MEKKINRKIETYIAAFKNDVRKQLLDAGFENKDKLNELLEFVNEYDRLVMQKEDFIKRKRVKNAIPQLNRCNAKRANGEQCTRRRRDDCEFCGTHYKGTPHGMINANEPAADDAARQNLEVVAEDIFGIVYYIDKYNNVYKTEDILKGIENPQVIAKCKRLPAGGFSIPEFVVA